jgi:UDP-glucose 4-epimerase
MPRRPGDPPELVADARRALDVLKWRPQHSGLDNIVATAWRWHSAHRARVVESPREVSTLEVR